MFSGTDNSLEFRSFCPGERASVLFPPQHNRWGWDSKVVIDPLYTHLPFISLCSSTVCCVFKRALCAL